MFISVSGWRSWITPKRDIDEADKRREVDSLVNILMGKKPELRFKYIQENASSVNQFDI